MAETTLEQQPQQVTAKLSAKWALVRELPRTSLPITVALLATLAASTVLGVANMLATARVVSRVLPAVRSGGLGSDAGRSLTIALAIVAVAFVVQSVISSAQQLL